MARLGRKRRAATDKAMGVAEAAKEFAEGESVRDFMATTGSAVREFATHVSDAAKDLLESTEKAASKARKQRKPRRGRKLLRLVAVLAVGGFAAGNEKVRSTITGQVRKLRGGQEPAPWSSDTAQADGEVREPASAT